MQGVVRYSAILPTGRGGRDGTDRSKPRAGRGLRLRAGLEFNQVRGGGRRGAKGAGPLHRSRGEKIKQKGNHSVLIILK